MRHTLSTILFALGGLLGLIVALRSGGARTLAAPPLSLDGFRDEKLPEGPHDSAGLEGINENCFVCHGNYRSEAFVLSHAKNKVGCIQCHGPSLPHQRDEDHRIPPDKMFARQAVDAMCQACHEEHNVPAVKVLKRWRERCPQRADPGDIVCTDCHNEHRLKSRSVVWDRTTGKVVSAGKGKTPAKP
jgi:hypothetical protein